MYKVMVKLDLYCNKVSQLLYFLTYVTFLYKYVTQKKPPPRKLGRGTNYEKL